MEDRVLLHWKLGFGAATMAKGRYSRGHGKRWSTLALVLSLLFMLTVVLLMLLALGIVSLPIGTVDSDAANDLSSFRRKTFDGY